MPEHNDIALRPDASSADQSKYLIYSRLEIASILNTLCKAGTMVTAYFGGGNDFILTSVAAVMPEQNLVCVDYGADDEANRRALRARKITFVAARAGGRDVFSMAIPDTLLRLQRREYFRIATPLAKPLVCIIPPQAKRASALAQVTVVDISCGGIAVIDSTAPAGIEAGANLRGCRILLPELGEVVANIVVKSTFEVTYKNGVKHQRAGCEFTGMREHERALIQRYINKLEREHRDRAGAR